MSSTKLLRWAGVTALAGGATFFAGAVFWEIFVAPTHEHGLASAISWGISLVAYMLILLALAALYARQAKQTGTFGMIAFLVAFAGTALMLGITWFGAFAQPGLKQLQQLAEGAGVVMAEPPEIVVGFASSAVFYVLGWLLFGIIELKSGALPRGAVIFAMLGPAKWLAAEFVAEAAGNGWLGILPIFEIGLVWIGYALLRSLKGESPAGVSPSTAHALHE
ncbi:MAG TPA: hypothetical protein VFZ76_00670 [Anaerolineales bacterium]